MNTSVECKSINIDDLNIDDLIELYPNPAASKLNIEIASGLIQEIVIYDLTGKLVQKISTNIAQLEIDISNLTCGLYFLSGLSEERTFRKRFVKY